MSFCCCVGVFENGTSSTIGIATASGAPLQKKACMVADLIWWVVRKGVRVRETATHVVNENDQTGHDEREGCWTASSLQPPAVQAQARYLLISLWKYIIFESGRCLLLCFCLMVNNIYSRRMTAKVGEGRKDWRVKWGVKDRRSIHTLLQYKYHHYHCYRWKPPHWAWQEEYNWDH